MSPSTARRIRATTTEALPIGLPMPQWETIAGCCLVLFAVSDPKTAPALWKPDRLPMPKIGSLPNWQTPQGTT